MLANAGKEVHVYVRKDSGARFDGGFQGIENWTSPPYFFDEMRSWGINPDSFKSNSFSTGDLAHPDDVITQPKTQGIAFRVVERGNGNHCIRSRSKKVQKIQCNSLWRYFIPIILTMLLYNLMIN